MAATQPLEPAAERLQSLLTYVEQIVRLDERPALRLAEHRLANGQAFVLHQHELHALPGLRHDFQDEEGPIWLAVERLRRSEPPRPTDEIGEWIEVSPDPDRPAILKEHLIRTFSQADKEALVASGAVRNEDCAASVRERVGLDNSWDVRFRLEDRPEIRSVAEAWLAEQWLPWTIAERPVRRSIALYQKLFELVQLAELGGGDRSFEVVWGMGLTRWLRDAEEIDLPLLERLVEIEIDEAAAAEIRVRPRAAPASVNLRAFEKFDSERVSLALDASRRTLDVLPAEDGVSPYRRDDFEPILRACQARLDPEGSYLPDRHSLGPGVPPPAATDRLVVSDRWVLFARRRSDSFVLADLENLKVAVARASEIGDLPGPARTLVMGPSETGPNEAWTPLTDRIGENVGGASGTTPDAPEGGDLFFPKPFNDDQIEIVRRLERSDGIVVQGPPGTGKTHTISNIICHYMATGRRVLVVSHGEPALAVLRGQLPEGVRDLAISITATEREGFRQLEAAVRLLQAVVESVKPGEQSRLIRDLEHSVVGLRNRLAEVDRDIERIALAQLIPAANGELPGQLAQRIVQSATRYDWFPDRPELSASDAGLVDADISLVREARMALGGSLEQLDAILPSVEDLPTGQVVAQLHDDLIRAERFAQAATRDPRFGVRITSPAALAEALRAADAAQTIQRVHAGLADSPWLKPIAAAVIAEGEKGGAAALLSEFVADATPVVAERNRYISLPVELPDAALGSPEMMSVVRRLAEGEQVFGLFAFKERSLRPLVDAIRVQGRAPTGMTDWTHVQQYLDWRDRLDSLLVRWKALAEEVGGPGAGSARDLGNLVGSIESVFREASAAMAALDESFARIVPGAGSARDLWRDPVRLAEIEDLFRNAVAAAQLSAARAEVARLEGLFPDRSGKIGRLARELLVEGVGRQEVDSDQVARLWTAMLRQIEQLGRYRQHFATVRNATDRIAAAGAPIWAGRLASMPSSSEVDPLIPPDWREAWDWAAAFRYLLKIDDRDRLRSLAEERVRLDEEIRKTFERVVRERTFYELGRSMTGPVRAALMMFATALRRTGKGTGKGAVRHRRDARSAMAQCYAAIPCWIMPAWRVAEQLPAEVGSFDLVIMDEASQSDIRELPALLRGKKILVVGDDKQVSPTAAFIENAKIDRLEHGFLRNQPFKTLLLPGSSLYDLAKVMFPDKLVMLREHFRCVEPIIRFSMQFYPEPLVPLRVPTAQERLDPPLVDIYVPDGRREGDKQNPREAEVIVDSIKELVGNPAIARIEAENRWRTIGVVSLIGAKQAARISGMLLEELGEDLIRRHHIACGDSATFQGAERDIVFLSMVADARNKAAQTAQQFEQRFNVALSRARDRLVLVRSVREEELKPDDLKARVIRHFHDPMAGAALPTGGLEEMCDSDFERDVLRRLCEAGYSVTPQVGALGYRIDLVVEGANGRRLAVECDGDKYHGPERWADDMRRQRILERVGWRFWRCWASSFTLDPDGCMADLFATLQRAGIEPTGGVRGEATFTAHLTASSRSSSADTEEAGNQSEPETEPATTRSPSHLGEVKKVLASPDGIKTGDRVIVRYLDDNKTASFTLSDARDDLTNALSQRHPRSDESSWG